MKPDINELDYKPQWCELCHKPHNGEVFQVRLYNERGMRAICRQCKGILVKARIIQEQINVSDVFKRFYVRSTSKRLPLPPSLQRKRGREGYLVDLEPEQVIILRALGFRVEKDTGEGGDVEDVEEDVHPTDE